MPVPDFSPGEVLTAAAMDSIGLWKVASGSLSGTATNFVGCFTSTYTNYRIVIESINVTTLADVYFRFLNGTTPFTSAAYAWAYTGIRVDAVTSNSTASGQDKGYTGITNTATGGVFGSSSLDVYGPHNSQRTFLSGVSVSYETNYYSRSGMAFCNDLTSFDGIRILTNTAATFTGNVTIYGYRK
jgi:hypothetical protein